MRPLQLALPLVASLAIALPASAQTARGYAVDRFQPAERGSEWFALDSLDLARREVAPAAGLTVVYGYRPLATYEADDRLRAAVVQDHLTLHAGGAVTLWSRVRFGANLPLQLAANGTSSSVAGVAYPEASSGQALGDLRLAVDARVYGETRKPATLALGARLHLPTGSPSAYSGDGAVRFEPRASFAGSMGMVAYAAHLGVLVRGRDDAIQGSPLGHELTFGAGGGVRLLGDRVIVGPELYGSTATADFGGGRATPLEALLGAHMTFARTWRAGAGVGFGLTRGFGTPIARGLLSIEWAPQEKSVVAAPPAVAAPTPRDRDKDGIADPDDACADAPGIAHPADPLTNGCPPDRDNDFVADDVDACPDARGTRSADPNKNGCPGDQDRDGVLDAEDACELEPGPRSDDPTSSGCAVLDKDKDGVLDTDDACPDVAGSRSSDAKKSGCPLALLERGAIKLTAPILFNDGSADFRAGETMTVLEAVAKVLTDHPEITRLRIEAHTDNTNAEGNKLLSQLRAAAVLSSLVGRGIDPSRLRTTGVGGAKPLAPNNTPEGRAQNRRIELVIEEGPK